MKKSLAYILLITFISCSHQGKKIQVSSESVTPGTAVKLRGKEVDLYSGSIKVGDSLPEKLKSSDMDFKFNNKVTIVSFVPSVNTKVCEEQTHLLGETKNLEGIDLVTLSRDLPMAQKRFAKEAKLENITYFSDYKSASFGKKTGLLMKGPELLARGVMVLDEKGVVRYLQVVDEVTFLPDMDLAFKRARELK